jgi:hypothetical protein
MFVYFLAIIGVWWVLLVFWVSHPLSPARDWFTSPFSHDLWRWPTDGNKIIGRLHFRFLSHRTMASSIVAIRQTSACRLAGKRCLSHWSVRPFFHGFSKYWHRTEWICSCCQIWIERVDGWTHRLHFLPIVQFRILKTRHFDWPLEIQGTRLNRPYNNDDLDRGSQTPSLEEEKRAIPLFPVQYQLLGSLWILSWN